MILEDNQAELVKVGGIGIFLIILLPDHISYLCFCYQIVVNMRLEYSNCLHCSVYSETIVGHTELSVAK